MKPSGEEARVNTGNELCFDEIVVRFSHETEKMLAGLRSIVRMANRLGEDPNGGGKRIHNSEVARQRGRAQTEG